MTITRLAVLASLALQMIGVAYISLLLPAMANAIGYLNSLIVVVTFLIGVSKLGGTLVNRIIVRGANRDGQDRGTHGSDGDRRREPAPARQDCGTRNDRD